MNISKENRPINHNIVKKNNEKYHDWGGVAPKKNILNLSGKKNGDFSKEEEKIMKGNGLHKNIQRKDKFGQNGTRLDRGVTKPKKLEGFL
jgi:hypothetical protein